MTDIVWSWPTHTRQVTRERKKSFLLPFLANAAYGCTNEGKSQLPGLSFLTKLETVVGIKNLL